MRVIRPSVRRQQLRWNKRYKVELDPRAWPTEISLSRDDAEDREVRLGIYELREDTLKLALGGSKNRPNNFEGQAILLKREPK